MAIATLAALLPLAPGCKPKAGPPPPPPAVPVVAAEVVIQDTTNYVEYVGQTRGAQDVEIRARVAGFLETVNFEEGGPVTNGALLYTIDEKPFRASLEQFQALLAQADAAWEKSRRDTNRFGPLWEKHAISRQQFDDALAAELAAAASRKAAQAAVDNANIQLGYTRITAPLDGIAGKTEVKPGNLVGQGQNTLLTTISSVNPIHVRFSVSEQAYLGWRRRHPSEDDNRAAGKGLFELLLTDGTLHPFRGDVVFGDRNVDPRTGTFLIEVAFPNPQDVLRPGQFARVRFPKEVLKDAVLVPQKAVQELQATYAVFVVGAGDKAEFRKVVPGPTIGNWYAIASGLKAGEKIVVEGIQKLQNGVPLRVTLTNLVPTVTTRP